jgi:pimeloyl-ACP methyl ester carboxylesterase
MSTAVLSGSDKSTNVRAVNATERAVRAGLLALAAASPPIAAVVGERIMFHTLRFARPAAERAVVARGERFEVASRHGRLAAWGFGEGPIVLLVHGWNGRGSQLAAFVDPLVAAGFRPVMFDAPGHGDTAGTASSLPEFADAVDAVLDAVRTPFSPVHGIIAHSMGGAAVTFAMSRHHRAPDVEHERALRDAGLPVRRFVFIAPPIDVNDFLRGFSRRMGLGAETTDAIRRRIEARFATALDDMYAPRLARELDAPLLVVHDKDDREVPLRCGELLAASWPGARLAVTEGLGHTRVLRDPNVTARVVAFLNDPAEP